MKSLHQSVLEVVALFFVRIRFATHWVCCISKENSLHLSVHSDIVSPFLLQSSRNENLRESQRTECSFLVFTKVGTISEPKIRDNFVGFPRQLNEPSEESYCWDSSGWEMVGT